MCVLRRLFWKHLYAGSFRRRSASGFEIDLNFTVSSSPSDNSIARRHAAMTFTLASPWAHAAYMGIRKTQGNPSIMTTSMEFGRLVRYND
jgi:hypothetical protein